MRTTRQRPTAARATLACSLVLLALSLWQPEAAVAQWATNGNDINNTNTGRVGIGTSTPTNAKVEITSDDGVAGGEHNLLYASRSGTNSGGFKIGYTADGTTVTGGFIRSLANLPFFLGTTGAPQALVINNSGNVGIGTAAASARLHIIGANGASGGAAPTALSVTGGAGGNSSNVGGAGGDLALQGGAGGWNTAGSSFHYSGNGGAVSLTGGTGGQHLFGVSHAGAGGAVNITGGTGGPHTLAGYAGGVGGSIVLNGGVGGTGSTPGAAGHVVLANLRGNVGVGTASPASRLSVFDANPWPTSNSGALYVESSNTVGSGLNLAATGAGGRNFLLISTANGASPGGGTFGIFDVSAGPTASSYRFVLNSAGNVGIGTLNPAHKLDVAGNVNSSGLCIGGVCKTAWTQVGGTSQWTTSGTSIHYTAGNVGVGTTTPSQPLGVQGMVGLYPQTFVQPNVRGMFMFHNGAGGSIYAYNYPGGTGDPISFSASTLDFNTYIAGTPNQRMFIANGGNIGVGTNAPASLLNLVGANAALTFGAAGASDSSAFSVAVAASGANTNSGHGRGLTVKAGDSDNAAGKLGGNLTLNPGAPVAPATAYGNVLVATAGGNVGVGTSAPAHKLDVAGNANATGLCIAGECKTAWSQVGGGATSQWTTNGTSIHYNSGNVGIGTASPTQKLDVAGGGRFSGLGIGLSVNNTGGWTQITAVRTGGHQAAFIAAPAVANSVSNPYWAMGLSPDGSAGWSLDTWDGAALTTRVRVQPGTGLFGIGTTAPTEKLHVIGGGRFDSGIGRVYVGAGAASGARGLEFLQESATVFSIRHHDPGVAWQHLALAPHGGNVGIGTGNANPGYRLDVQGGAVNASGGLCIAGECKTAWSQVGGGATSQWTTNGTSIHYNAGGVGIGTTTPSAKLVVTGGANTAVQIGDRGLSGSVGLQMLGSGYKHAGLRFDGDNLVVENASLSHTPSSWHLGGQPLNFIVRNGNVGIGTTAPTERLHVEGNVNASGTVTAGNIVAKYQDVAEWVPSTQRLAAGTVVVLDAERVNHVLASSESYDTRVAGVVSGQPGIILGEGGEGKVMVATTGRVRVKADATRAPIRIGDLLVTGEVEGVAMKSEPVTVGGRRMHAPGTIIGKALEPLEKGTGEILVLLSLQ